MYQKQIDRQCKIKLTEANAAWAASQNADGAATVAALLTEIDPSSSCYKDVKVLSDKVGARMKEINNQEWNYVLKEQAQESERIKAIRDIGVAYGNGQPKTVNYNVRGWY